MTATMTTHQGETVRLADLVDETFHLREHEFVDCVILGPVVVMLASGISRFYDSEWDASVETVLRWRTRRRVGYTGCIGLVSCTFRRCEFRHVALALPRRNRWRLRRAWWISKMKRSAR